MVDTPSGGPLNEAEEPFGPPTLHGFRVSLENFQGPFDLLLRLIASKELDLTQVALAEVTDEFLAYIRRVPSLSSATDFLVVAATLLRMKAAALLPRMEGESEDLEEDLEAWEILFARLLQLRAFQTAGATLGRLWDEHAGTIPRVVPLPPPFNALLSPLRWEVSGQEIRDLAASALTEPVRPDLADHVGRLSVSFDEELSYVRGHLRREPETTFDELVAGAPTAVVVARFLAVLQLYRDGVLSFEQTGRGAPLRIRNRGER